MSAVSTTFRSASGSDTVWERFLPSDLDEILSRAVDRIEFQSKRDLYFHLCNPVLLDGGRLCFSLERPTGRKCYTLSARALVIEHGESPENWKWGRHDDSRRLSDVLKLLSSEQPKCPQLYIYSSADRVIPATSVESFIERQRRAGHEIRACDFINSPHVDHYRNHPALYTSQLTAFLEDCVLNCYDGSS